MVEAGAQQVERSRGASAPSNSATSAASKIAAGIRELVTKAGKPKREFTPPPVDQELYEQIATQVRADLTDALNTGKYAKLESYHARRRASRRRLSTGAAGRADGRSRRPVRSL